MPGADIRAVLFDAGNTLIHLDHAFIAAQLAQRGMPIGADRLQEAEYTAKDWVDRDLEARRAGRDAERRESYFSVLLDSAGVPPDLADNVLAELQAAHAADCLWRVIAPDTASVLTTLRVRGYPLGVVSNADGRVEHDLRRRGLDGHFERVIDSHHVGIEKPDPRIFALGLEAVRARPEHALYVGDIYSIDVQGARAAGLSAILLDPLDRYHSAACVRIRTLADLLDRLPARTA